MGARGSAKAHGRKATPDPGSATEEAVTRLNDVAEIVLSARPAFARLGRDIEAWRDAHTSTVRFYDRDYGIELGSLQEAMLRKSSRDQVLSILREACREPSSLEILHYAQIGGPHVRGEAFR